MADTHSCRKDAFYGAHQKNMNEDRPILLGQKCRAVVLLSGNIRYMQTFAGFLGNGVSNDTRVVDDTNF